MKPIAIDLFCGAGGMSEGLLQAGFHIAFSSDINENVKTTYMNRHEQMGLIQGVNTHFELSDIRELSGEKIINCLQPLECFEGFENITIDAIFGGPPCQGFSRAGLRKKDDPRNMLFKEYLRIVNEIQPRYVVMENVEGMLDTKLDGFEGVSGKIYPNNTYVIDLLKSEFPLIGFDYLEPRLMDASDYGVPQRRKRVIFIAYRKGQAIPEYPEKTHPNPENKVTVLDAIGDLILEEKIRKTFNPVLSSFQKASKIGRTKSDFSFDKTFNHELSTHSELIKERLSLYSVGESSQKLKKRIQMHGVDLSNYPCLTAHCSSILNISEIDVIEQFKNNDLSKELVDILLTKKNSRVRLNPSSPSPTMLTSGDDYVHPFEPRGLTVREMARLQSFDDSFEFLGKRTTGGLRRRVEVPQYTQVGNAVPPLLSRAVALKILEAIHNH